MKTISAVIIDDEPKSLKLIQNLVTEIDENIHISDLIRDPFQAIDVLNVLQPDLIFLDINMPGLSGFDLLSKLINPQFEIIFITGYDQYAMQAIKLSACGYILKPIDKDDLETAITLARARIELRVSSIRNKVLLHNVAHSDHYKKIGLPCSTGIVFVQANDILCCERAHKKVKLTLHNDEIIYCDYSLGELNKILSPLGFFKLVHAVIFNLNHRDHMLFKSDQIIASKTMAMSV